MEKNIKLRTGAEVLDVKIVFGDISVKVVFAFIEKPTKKDALKKYYESYKIKASGCVKIYGDVSALKIGDVYMDNNETLWEYMGEREFKIIGEITNRFSTKVEFFTFLYNENDQTR